MSGAVTTLADREVPADLSSVARMWVAAAYGITDILWAPCQLYPVVIQSTCVVGFFDIDVLDDDDPFEVDDQVAHLFKHAALGLDDVYECGSRTRSSIRPNRRRTG